jgi:hypothetical protein
VRQRRDLVKNNTPARETAWPTRSKANNFSQDKSIVGRKRKIEEAMFGRSSEVDLQKRSGGGFSAPEISSACSCLAIVPASTTAVFTSTLIAPRATVSHQLKILSEHIWQPTHLFE